METDLRQVDAPVPLAEGAVNGHLILYATVRILEDTCGRKQSAGSSSLCEQESDIPRSDAATNRDPLAFGGSIM